MHSQPVRQQLLEYIVHAVARPDHGHARQSIREVSEHRRVVDCTQPLDRDLGPRIHLPNDEPDTAYDDRRNGKDGHNGGDTRDAQKQTQSVAHGLSKPFDQDHIHGPRVVTEPVDCPADRILVKPGDGCR